MNDLKISVVIPIYNVKDYLKECVDSVLFQTVKPYEIILVDDGSTDGSEKICDDYSKEELIKVIHKQNKGVSSARNTGIKESNGDYICFVDGDDYIEKTSIENYITIINEYGKVDCVIDRMKLFYSDSNEFFKTNDFYIDNEIAKGKTGKEAFAVTRKKYKRFDVGIRGIYSLSLIRNNSIYFDEKLKYNEDIRWMIEVVLKANNGILGSKTANYCYRTGRENSSQNTFNLKRIDDFIAVYNYWHSLIESNKKNDEFLKEFKKELGKRYIRLFSRTLCRVNDDNYEIAKEHILDNSNLLEYCYPENKKTLCFYILNKLFGSKKAIKLYMDHLKRDESK